MVLLRMVYALSVYAFHILESELFLTLKMAILPYIVEPKLGGSLSRRPLSSRSCLPISHMTTMYLSNTSMD